MGDNNGEGEIKTDKTESSPVQALTKQGEEKSSQDTGLGHGVDATKTELSCRRVMKPGEEKSFQDLGLGRGVDATNPTPWLNKRPLQIRQVFYNDIIGTEEGNLYQGFVNEVESTQHFQTNLSASVPVNQLVNLGIDSELSRSYSVSQKSVGRKITTRTISFQANFDRISEMQDGTSSKQSQSQTERKIQPFEHRLKEWIKQQNNEEKTKEQILNSQKGNQDQQKEGQNEEIKPQGKGKQDGEDKKTVVITLDGVILSQEECFDLCYKFVSTFSVTHYVHSLELGASLYRVMSLEEYSTKFSSKAKLGVGQLADIAIGNERSFNARKYKSQTTKVGRMKQIPDDDSRQHGIHLKKDDDQSKKDKDEDSKTAEIEEEVQRSTIEEAVVGVKLQSISSLVICNIGLRIALQKALQQYIHNKQKIKFGPFYIACNWDQLYLTVNKSKDYQVEATYNIDKASEFYVVRCDEGDNHFYIVCETPVSFKREMDKKKFVARVGEVEHKPAIPMYLCASVNWRGKSKRNQPLRMRLDGKSTNSRLAIHNRKDQHFHPADLTEWVNEKEIFFINCQERSITAPISSYLCVYESGETGCKPAIKSHDDKRKFMLFRLIKPKEKAKPSSLPTAPVDNNLITGPFLIKHTRFNEDLFVMIGDENEVQVTGDIKSASPFFIRRVSDYSNYFEILSANDQELHLTATVDWRGHGIHPPKLRRDANGWSYLAIYDKKSQPKDMKLEDPSKCGEDEKETFYISCYIKPAFSKDASYLIVNRETNWRGNAVHYWIGCVPSIKHNKKDGEPMLFKLVKPPQEEEQEEVDTPPPPRVQGDDGAVGDIDNDSVHIEVTAEIH